MKIKTAINYNLDLLCFLNSMTGNKFIADFHKESFEKFYPMVSKETKHYMNRLKRLNMSHLVAPCSAMIISAMDDFTNRDLIEMLSSHAEMEEAIIKTPYGKNALYKWFMLNRLIRKCTVPLVRELEAVGFKEFWYSERLPLLEERSKGIIEYMEQYGEKAHELINRFISMDSSDYTIYLCTFANPMGIKLCGNSMAVDYTNTNDDILEILTHEPFHPPYNDKTVKKSVKALAKKPWVKAAYKNQNPNSRYFPIAGFVEENIVEALGIHVVVKLGLDIDPAKYFVEHDYGSHVISPFFYDYLCANEKDHLQSFEDYFVAFVDSL